MSPSPRFSFCAAGSLSGVLFFTLLRFFEAFSFRLPPYVASLPWHRVAFDFGGCGVFPFYPPRTVFLPTVTPFPPRRGLVLTSGPVLVFLVCILFAVPSSGTLLVHDFFVYPPPVSVEFFVFCWTPPLGHYNPAWFRVFFCPPISSLAFGGPFPSGRLTLGPFSFFPLGGFAVPTARVNNCHLFGLPLSLSQPQFPFLAPHLM